MIPTIGVQPLYSVHLKKNTELYIKNDSLVVIHNKKGNVFAMNLGIIRCAYPVSHDTVKIFWRAPKNKGNAGWKYWHRYQHDFKIDFKKSFPDKQQRKMAEKTEATKLANILLHAAQVNHSVTKPNTRGHLALHADEHLIGFYDAQCKYGKGVMLITNLGIYFTVKNQGLCLDMPLDILDSYDFKNQTVKIHYFEPMWRDGYDQSSRKNRNIELRIIDESAQTVCDGIGRAYSDGGAKVARMLAQRTKEFGSMTPNELFAEYYAGKEGVFKPINDYCSLLANKMWGIPTTEAVEKFDNTVVRVCLFTGIPLDVAGKMTQKDREFREETMRYHRRYEEYARQYRPLHDSILDIIRKNLNAADSEKIKNRNPYVTFDTIQELVKNESVSESFMPKSVLEYKEFKRETNAKIIAQESIDYPNGLKFEWTDDVFCPWSLDDAKRIVSDKDFVSILDAIISLNAEYGDIDKFMPGPMYSKTFEITQYREVLLRIRRVYDHWCISHLPNKCTNKNRNWIQYVINNVNMQNQELFTNHHDEKQTAMDVIRTAESESQNTKTRLERIIIPKKIPACDIYADAWHDKSKHVWFTTNPFFRISDPDIHIMNPDECEQKYGFRAMAFPENMVHLKHGYPAIYNESGGWWVLLCTIHDEQITAEMVNEKFVCYTLSYEVSEPSLTLGNDGVFVYMTEQEYILDTLDHRLPFNERVRRLIFTKAATHCVIVTPEDKKQMISVVA